MKQIILTVVCFLFLQIILKGQVDYDKYPQVSSSYFLQDVYLVEDGTPKMTNIHLNDGFIVQVGKSLKRPKGAIQLEADSMYVYPAFIDVLSHYGIKKSENKEKVEIKFPGMPPDKEAGITPDLSAQDLIASSTPDFSKLRDNGYAISQIANKYGMLPGSTTIALLVDDKSKRVFTDKTNQFGQFEAASGIYPATIIGIMAKFRDLYRNAEVLKKNKDTYSRSSANAQMPSSSDAIEALVPLTLKQQTMYFYPEKKLNTLRAIRLKKELGFNMNLVGIEDIAGLEDLILKENIPLALSIALPKEIKEEKQDSTAQEVSEEVKALTERRMKAYKQRMSLASYLESKSVPFAFSLGSDTGNDLKKNLKRLIDSGLTEQGAIDALTINAATMLGIADVAGSVTKGKFSNLMITDAPYFDEKSNIRMMVVGSETYEYEVKTKEDKPADESLAIEGVWDFSLDTPGGKETGTIKIEKVGDSYTIYTASSDDPSDPEINEDVSLSGNTLEYGFDMTDDGFTMPLSFSLQFTDSETMGGSVSLGEYGAFPISANKVSSPE